MFTSFSTALSALNEERFTVAAVALAFACYLKIYPISLAMLVIVIFPRKFGARFALAMIAGALVPFLTQDPSYVARQYGRWVDNLVEDDRSDWPVVNGYLDGWLLIRALGLPVSFEVYRVFTAVAGALLGLLVLELRLRGDSGRDFLQRVFALGCCWMTLLGPATEGHTYILLGAPAAWLAIEAGRGALPVGARRAAWLVVGLLYLSLLCQATPLVHVVPCVWMPLAALLLAVTLTAVAIRPPTLAGAASPVRRPDAGRLAEGTT